MYESCSGTLNLVAETKIRHTHTAKGHQNTAIAIWLEKIQMKCTCIYPDLDFHDRCGSRIWSRGAPASEAESCRRSGAESCERSKLSAAGVQGHLRALEAFEFLVLKYAFSHILEPLFSYFWYLHQDQKLTIIIKWEMIWRAKQGRKIFDSNCKK